MKWLYERLYRKNKGFTLIELLIVIIILAVLAGIAIPSYLAITNRAKISATEAEMSSIAVALEMYNADIGNYPATLALLSSSTPVYMATVPTKDKWGTAYVYAPSTAPASSYTLTSKGKDATATTDDIIFTNGQMTQPTP
jgi:general secretion pathway protein G